MVYRCRDSAVGGAVLRAANVDVVCDRPYAVTVTTEGRDPRGSKAEEEFNN